MVAHKPEQAPLALMCEMFGDTPIEVRGLTDLCLGRLAEQYQLTLNTKPSLAYVHTGLTPATLRQWQAAPLTALVEDSQPEGHAEKNLCIGCAEPYSAGLWLHRMTPTFTKITRQLVNPWRLQELLATISKLGGHAQTGGNAWVDLAHATRLEQIDTGGEQNESSIVDLCHSLFAEAIAKAASDLHLEVREDGLVVLARIDGMLHELLRLNQASGKLLTSRIKLLARLDITEQRRPQDGRISVLHAGKRQEIRTSVIPTIQGEKVVLRFFDPLLLTRSLDGLGIPDRLLTSWKQLLARKAGMLLTVGPTGSGKTSTLYASLGLLANEPLNICTVEDPVEIIEPRFSQMQVNHELSLDFAAALKHLLRQDPDIIMVGEIRDGETARTAVQAALTGHLLLASLHTTDALGAVLRLRELGVPGYLLGGTLSGIMAQRLVRKLCRDCNQHTRLACEACGGSGYNGRHAIFELLVIDETLIHALEHRPRAELDSLLAERGHQSLWRAGRKLVEAGVTDLEEVRRVCPQE